MYSTRLRQFVTAFWAMREFELHQYREIVAKSIEASAALVPFQEEESKASVRMALMSHPDRQSQVRVGDVSRLRRWYGDEIREDDDLVNLVDIQGPIMREWNCDNIGTKEMRDRIITASNDPQCRGHLLFINSPGGQADSMNDMIMAIDYAHSKGLPVVAFVDGMAASCGYGILALCDEAYFMNPKDEVGSIGVMATYTTRADKTVNTVTGDVFHMLYSKYSTDKNDWYRKSAEGNDKPVLDDLDMCAEEFIATIKCCRPRVTAEQTTGKMFPCGAVIGSMIEGQSTFDETALRVLSCKPRKTSIAESVTGSLAESKKKRKCGDREGAPAENSLNPNSQPQNSTDMPFTQIKAVLGTPELATQDGGSYLNAEQLAAIEAQLETNAEKVLGIPQAIEEAVSQQQAASQEQLDALTTAHQEAITAAVEQARLEAAEATQTLEADHAAKVEEMNQLLLASQQNEERLTARIALLEAEAETLAGTSSEQANTAPPATDNGASVASPKQPVDPNASLIEQQAQYKAWRQGV